MGGMKMKMLCWLAAAVLMIAGVEAAGAASTNPIFTINSSYDLYDLGLYGIYTPPYYDAGTDATYIDQFSYNYAASAGTSIVQHRTGFVGPVNNVAFIGLSDLGDPGSAHVVVGVNADVAASIVGKTFEQAFPLYAVQESQVAAGLIANATTPTASTDLSNLRRQIRNNAEYASADDGQLVLVAFSTGQIVGTVAVSGAVPEPASWALMLAGFGFVATAVRRQRRSRSGSPAGRGAGRADVQTLRG